ncbi:MAG: cyclic nucleotide-binding domain-containing protein [Rhizobiaceae bacterium]
MRPSERKLIRTLPLFRDVKGPHFETLVDAGFLQRFPPHVMLIREGDLPDFLHIVVEGTVELFSTDAGRETTLDIIHPVATFILAAVIRDEPYLKSGRTLTAAQVLMIPAPAVRDVFGRDAAFARAVVDELAIRYRGIVRALKNQKLRSGTERLANWILRADVNNGGAGHYTMPHDKRTLASLLGMTPENLSLNLAELKTYGVISSGRDIVVEDRAALERFARPNPLIDS